MRTQEELEVYINKLSGDLQAHVQYMMFDNLTVIYVNGVIYEEERKAGNDTVSVPYEVGQYIDKCKEENLTFINMIDKGSYPSKMHFWLANKPENHEKLTRAWVVGHTKEEKEDMYYIIVAVDKVGWEYCYIDRLGSPDFTNYLKDIPTFTEKEIRKMDERFMAFAVKVGDE